MTNFSGNNKVLTQWEQNNRKKHHLRKIENAKSVVNIPKTQRPKSSSNSTNQKNNQSRNNSGLKEYLSCFKLDHFIDRLWSINITTITDLKLANVEELCSSLKLFPGQRIALTTAIVNLRGIRGKSRSHSSDSSSFVVNDLDTAKSVISSLSEQIRELELRLEGENITSKLVPEFYRPDHHNESTDGSATNDMYNEYSIPRKNPNLKIDTKFVETPINSTTFSPPNISLSSKGLFNNISHLKIIEICHRTIIENLKHYAHITDEIEYIVMGSLLAIDDSCSIEFYLCTSLCLNEIISKEDSNDIDISNFRRLFDDLLRVLLYSIGNLDQIQNNNNHHFANGIETVFDLLYNVISPINISMYIPFFKEKFFSFFNLLNIEYGDEDFNGFDRIGDSFNSELICHRINVFITRVCDGV